MNGLPNGDRVRRVLVVGSLPLAAPWNGADKALARTIVTADTARRYVVQSGRLEEWPDHVEPVRETRAVAIPDRRAELRAVGYVLRHARGVDLIHVVASLRQTRRPAAHAVRTISHVLGRPVVHSLPALAEHVDPTTLVGDVTVVFSRHTQALLESAGVPEVFRAFPPLPLDGLRPSEPSAAARKRFELGPRPILYAAHVDEGSGIEEAMGALTMLPASLRDAKLALALRLRAGQDTSAAVARLEALAARLGIADRVRILTDVAEMPSLISACVVTVLVPRRLLGKMDLPLVLLESLALGRPIVVADRPPINEALLGGGMEVPFGDLRALADALTTLLEDDALRHELGSTGRRQVLELSDPARVGQVYGPVYQRALHLRAEPAISHGV